MELAVFFVIWTIIVVGITGAARNERIVRYPRDRRTE